VTTHSSQQITGPDGDKTPAVEEDDASR